MLDTATKKRIDDARQILVGKVPDPKSQVEQITIALIYKFMDDMDRESETMGGKASFFVKSYAKYSWRRIFAPKLSGAEQLQTYSEALEKLSLNEALPELFREIFKNAYLPYRDPETLRLFLKTIGEFEYDHSERLGDAFEYLLSVLGSQGDAGQFRTPRHVIDFMVEVVDPQKNETILDPACGTAGFLISAWKHIRAANTTKRLGDRLKPADKTRLMDNVVGYDISPDMVRLSLVNLYLHGFARPKIYEYDSLTSIAHWDEHFDVIMANPPFMSPKGGIRPHKKFSVESSRSEVLFVDYIAEHLLPSGRAGIIVPEGIIFQSQGAYVQLRKMLVEESLVAVVSLPAGVFNPYSGVKTSILILDKALAKKASTIAFFKVENDGFGLGAQRREIEKNDLPQVKAEVAEYLRRLRAGEAVEDLQPTLGLIVEKEKVVAKGEYNLSGERYREGIAKVSSWPFVSIGKIFQKSDQTVLPESLSGPITYIGLENIVQNNGKIEGNIVTDNPADIRSLKNIFKPHDILYGKLRPNLNKVWLADRKGICSTDIFVLEALERKADSALSAYLLRSKRFNDAVMGQLKGAQLPRIGWSSFCELKIPLPPLDVQKEIVAEIEGYQKVIDGARAVIENYRPHIPIRPEWPMVELDSISTIVRGSSPRPQGDPKLFGGPVPRLMVADITRDGMYTTPLIDSLTKEGAKKSRPMKKGDVIITVSGNPGLPTILAIDACIHDGFVGLRDLNKKVLPEYLYFSLVALHVMHGSQSVGAVFKNLTTDQIRGFKIALPPLSTQRAIVAEIEAEQALVAANRELIGRFEKKIQGTLGRVWGEEREHG